MRNRFGSLGILALILAISGCAHESITLSHNPLSGRAERFDEPLAVGRRAEDLRDNRSRIGRSTVTVFAFTGGSIHTMRPVEERVVQLIAEALETIGYQVNLVDSPSAVADTPAMNVTIEKFSFQNYTWLWPYVPTWGEIILGVDLRDPKGNVVFEKSFAGSGRSSSMEESGGFLKATREAMTEILEEILTAAVSDEFRIAFEAASGPLPGGDVAAPPPRDERSARNADGENGPE